MSENQARERMQIRLSRRNVERLNILAERYGMTANSIVSFIVGQWLDANFELRDKMQEKAFQVVEEQVKQFGLDQLMHSPSFSRFKEEIEKMVD